MALDVLIGVDVGTTTVKAAAVDLDGRLLARFARPYPTSRTGDGRVEQDARAWSDAVSAALREMAATMGTDGSVAGIGLTSQVNTHVFVDGDGAPLAPAIVWQDVRCGSDAAALDARVSPEDKTRWFGGPMPIDASHALSRIAHVARAAPDVFAATRHVLLPKDFCALHLTGEVATDPVSSIGLVDRDHRYVEELIALVPGARERLAPLVDVDARVGVVKAGEALAGTPVFIGTMDAWAGMLGVGAVTDGDALYLSGTSEVPGIVADNQVPTPGVIVFPPYHGIRFHAAPTQSGGASLDWVARLVNLSPEEALARAAEVPPDATVPMFLPHLQGERAPLWDPASRGVFARLDGATDTGALVRSVLEGVAYSARLAFVALEASTGTRPDAVRMGGGGARSDLWCQIRADVLGKEVRRTAVTDAGVLGAALMAGVGCGAYTSLAQAADRLVSVERTFVPDGQAAARHDVRFDRYQRLYETIKPFNEGFGA